MANKNKIVTVRGPVHWVDSDQAMLGQTTVATFQNNDKLVITLTCPDGTYSIELNREFGDHFAGEWSWREGARTVKGHASGTLYKSGNNFFIFGRWVEETEQHWWAELAIVKSEEDDEV